MTSTQARWEEQLEIAVKKMRAPSLALTKDSNYSNTGVLRFWRAGGFDLVLEVYYNWQGGAVSLAPVQYSEFTLPRRASFGSEQAGLALEYLLSTVEEMV